MTEPRALARRAVLALVTSAVLGVWPSMVPAADNQATGDIAGVDADLSDSNVFSLSATTLSLVKQARNTSGTVLPDGTDVNPGQTIYFVLYVDNPTSFAAIDLRITDLIDESQFTYVADSLEQTVVGTGSGDAAIWAGTWTALSDDVGLPDDTASAMDTGGPSGRDQVTVGAVPAQTNLSTDVPATSIRAIRFRVTVN